MIVVTPKQMKYLESKADSKGNTYEILMETAGKKLSERLYDILKNKHNSILFLCGNGNNAGDCFVADRYLSGKNVKCVIAMLCGEPKTDISKLNFNKLNNMEIIYEKEVIKSRIASNSFDLIVDGVFGTGFHGDIPDDIREVFDVCRDAQIIAVDVPSGGNCRTGYVSDGTLKADETITFGFQKFGMTQYPLKSYCGNINIADIGISEDFAEDFDCIIKQSDFEYARNIIPEKTPDSHKGTYGRLLLICGSESMPGACIMAAEAAARSGVGLLEIAAPKSVLGIIASRLPEAMLCPLETDNDGFFTENNYNKIIAHSKKATAVLIGCGIGETENTKKACKTTCLRH